MEKHYMTTQPNRFFHGFATNDGNPKSHFKLFYIETVHDISDYNGGSIIERVSRMEDYYFNEERVDEPYYVVYASLKDHFNESSKFIGAFDQLNMAISLVEHLTGNKVTETDVGIYRP